MKMKLLVTVLGHDRPGLVKQISDTIKQQKITPCSGIFRGSNGTGDITNNARKCSA